MKKRFMRVRKKDQIQWEIKPYRRLGFINLRNCGLQDLHKKSIIILGRENLEVQEIRMGMMNNVFFLIIYY